MEGKGQSQVINLSQFHEPVPRCHMKVLKSRWKAINMGLLTGYGGCPTFQWPWPEVEFVAKHENRNTSLVSLFKANTLSWTSAQLRYNCNWSHQLQSVCVHSQNMLQTCTESPRPGKQNKNREGNKILNIRSTKRKKNKPQQTPAAEMRICCNLRFRQENIQYETKCTKQKDGSHHRHLLGWWYC